jgi:hypothetical protein
MIFYLIIFLAYIIHDEIVIIGLVAVTTFNILDTLFPSIKESSIHNTNQYIGFNSLNKSF